MDQTYFEIVPGVGEVEIDFLMDVDIIKTSGLAASEIRIETDTQPLILKRDNW